MHVISAESMELFTGPPEAPLQLVRVTHTGGAGEVRVEGDGLTTPTPAVADADAGIVEVPVAVSRPVVGEQRSARVLTGDAPTPFVFTVAQPGWTMYMISHFHYDPVWWNTQAAYTSVWTEDPPGRCRQTNGFDLVRAHLEMARREPEYKFVLAEVDYLKPSWDTHPEDRDDLRRFIADGRVEVMGGAYNEPNTNLTGPETTIRNFVHGMGFQRDVLGAAGFRLLSLLPRSGEKRTASRHAVVPRSYRNVFLPGRARRSVGSRCPRHAVISADQSSSACGCCLDTGSARFVGLLSG